jgi:hypothetical protein
MPQPIDWTALVQSIADDEAILVLGPNAIPYYRGESQASFSELSRRYIHEQGDPGLHYYYAKDHLYQFEDAAAKQRARKQVRSAARTTDWLPDSELLRQIVALPFPVVISLSPTKHLFDAFHRYWRAPQFDYFTTRDKPQIPSISYPDGQDNPLLYQLAGSVLDKRDSIILDYHDLFTLIKQLLADVGVPAPLARKLQEADRFLLLGFELERWYFQLFLHYINRVGSDPFSAYKENYPILCELSKDSQEFIMRQFHIEHRSLSRSAFDQLYAACEAAGILRPLSEPGSPVAQQVRQLVIGNQLEAACQVLAQELDPTTAQVDLNVLRSRYADYLQQKNQGTGTDQDLNRELNQLRYALLTIANEIGTS